VIESSLKRAGRDAERDPGGGCRLRARSVGRGLGVAHAVV